MIVANTTITKAETKAKTDPDAAAAALSSAIFLSASAYFNYVAESVAYLSI